jgi:hypothetical protein
MKTACIASIFVFMLIEAMQLCSSREKSRDTESAQGKKQHEKIFISLKSKTT